MNASALEGAAHVSQSDNIRAIADLELAELAKQSPVLAEQEITTLLNMVRDIHGRLGIAPGPSDPEIEAHARPTDLKGLSSELDRALPQE